MKLITRNLFSGYSRRVILVVWPGQRVINNHRVSTLTLQQQLFFCSSTPHPSENKQLIKKNIHQCYIVASLNDNHLFYQTCFEIYIFWEENMEKPRRKGKKLRLLGRRGEELVSAASRSAICCFSICYLVVFMKFPPAFSKSFSPCPFFHQTCKFSLQFPHQ
jgi:hypothetical protein